MGIRKGKEAMGAELSSIAAAVGNLIPFHELAHRFLSPMPGIIPPLDPPTCQVGIKDSSKAYKAVIRSVSNKFEALLNRLSRKK